MKSNWTKEENEICSRYFLRTYVIEKRSLPLSAAAAELHDLLPARSESTLRMKLSNCKALSIENGLTDTAPFSALENTSFDHRVAFGRMIKDLGL